MNEKEKESYLKKKERKLGTHRFLEFLNYRCPSCDNLLQEEVSVEITRVYTIDEEGNRIRCIKSEKVTRGSDRYSYYTCSKCGWRSEFPILWDL